MDSLDQDPVTVIKTGDWVEIDAPPIAIGLGLTLIHLVGIPVTNLSVNPARNGPGHLRRRLGAAQLWLFWVAPIVGAPIAGTAYRALFEER